MTPRTPVDVGVEQERTLVLMRHGKSDWSQALSDPQRPLAPRGRRQARVCGQWMAAALPGMDAAVASPAERTRQTLREVLDAGARVGRVGWEPELYTDAVAAVLQVIGRTPSAERALLVVAHEPALSGVVHHLTGTRQRVRTSEVVVLTWVGTWWVGASAARLVVAGRPPGDPTG